jgi:hypothetical protein
MTVRVKPPMERDSVVVVSGFEQLGVTLAPARISGSVIDTTLSVANVTIAPSATLSAAR